MQKFRLKLNGNIDRKTILIGGVCVTILCVAFGAKMWLKEKARKAAIAAANDFSIKALSVDQLEAGNLYVKDGDVFYKVPSGLFVSSERDPEEITKEADGEHRAMMFGRDDESIPTLYKDEKLIYKISGPSTPSSFPVERYKDLGWTIGVRSLVNEHEQGKYHVKIEKENLYPETSFLALNANPGDDIILDKIGGMPLTKKNVSENGTILGLSKGQTYTVDAYRGTDYIGLDAVADTHMFSSYETYDWSDYEMDPNGYLILSVPEDMWSGYYRVNGAGFFRYVNHSKAEGETDIDYNVPYYVGDEKNSKKAVNKANSDERVEKTTEINADDFRWNYSLTLDNPQKTMTVQIDYSDAQAVIGGNLVSESNGADIPGASIPKAVLVSPRGEKHEFVVDTEKKSVLTAKVENPETGTWNVEVSGMYARTFDVNTSFAGSATNMIVKNGDGAATMTIYLDQPMTDGIFTFKWEDKSHAGIFDVVNSNEESIAGNESHPESVQKEAYGEVQIHVGAVSAGEYKVNISGESLGHVYFSKFEAADKS